MNAITVPAGNSMIPTDMGAAMRLAEMMSTGKLVPSHLQKSPGDCLMVVELAIRFRMSPFAVAQCTSVIQGKLMLEGKLVAAAINSSGVLEDRLAYDFSGVNDTRAVTVRGTMRGETEPREMMVTLKEAQTTNPLWKKQPDQQLVYFATRAWARRHAPEVMLGVYSPEEFDHQPQPRETFAGPTIEAHPEPKPAAPDPETRPRKLSVADWLDALALECASCTHDELDEILSRNEVQQAQDRFRNGAADRLNHIIHEALKRTAPTEGHPADDPFVEHVQA